MMMLKRGWLYKKEEEFIIELIKAHPRSEQKIGTWIKKINIVQSEFSSKQKRFEIERTDGTKCDFSYKKCITGDKTKGRLKTTFIYFIVSEDKKYVKIGKSNDVNARLKTLQTGNPNKLEVVCIINETNKLKEVDLHRKFFKHRTSGEWFNYCDEIKTFISSIKI